MNKRQSLDILDQCINWVKDASDTDVENMRKIYREETQKVNSMKDDSLFLMPDDIPFVIPAFHIPYMNMSENEAIFEEVDE